MNLELRTREAGPSGMWATFHLADEVFAVPVEEVQEVLMEQPLTPVPRAPEFVLGLLNLRGQIMTAIDLRRRLDFPAREAERKQSVIVLRVLDAPVSVLVDEIGDVLALPVSSWMGPPETLSPSHRRFVTAICPVEGQVVLGLNVRKLLEPVEGEMRGHG